MAISVNGQSVTITNCTITFNNAFDPTTGTATITITPSGGLGTLPGVISGTPGLPAQFRNINLTQIPSGQSLPNPAATVTTVNPGGPGIASLYDLNLNLNAGATGPAGSNATIGGASDLTGTPTVQFVPTVTSLSPTAFTYQSHPFSDTLVPSVINSTSGSGAVRTLCTVQGNYPYPWYPVPFGQCIVTGTANTRVDLSSNLSSQTGTQVGYAFGANGVTSWATLLIPAIPAASQSAAKIAANTTATIYFVASQKNTGVTDSWTTSNTTTTFQVGVLPVHP